jgi:hypothetical protein
MSSLCLSVGYKGTLPLWKPFTVIKIHVSKTRMVHFDATVRALQTAIDDWNATNPDPNDPRPRFERVRRKEEATCQVKFRRQPAGVHNALDQKKGDLLARAFFPGDDPVIIIYSAAFQDENRPFLKNVFYHELIHVQGVRHYFAPGEDMRYDICPSTTIGRDDELSVSNYLFPLSLLKIRDSDVDALKALYSLSDATYKGFPVSRYEASLLSALREQDESDIEYECAFDYNEEEIKRNCGYEDKEGWYIVERT